MTVINPAILGLPFAPPSMVEQAIKIKETGIAREPIVAPFAPTIPGREAEAIYEARPTPPPPEPKAEAGAVANLLSTLGYGVFGLGGGAAITAAKLATGGTPTAADVALGQIGGGLLGVPATIATAALLEEQVKEKGLIVAPEYGLPSVAPEGVAPIYGQVGYGAFAPEITISGIGAGAAEAFKLPDLGDIGKYALIAGAALAGIYLIGKAIGGRR